MSYIKFVTSNYRSANNSPECSCIYCFSIFPGSAIHSSIDDVDGPTAVCPVCKVDAVLSYVADADQLCKWHVEGWGKESALLIKWDRLERVMQRTLSKWLVMPSQLAHSKK